MKVLGIESSCDETACAIVEDGRKILSNVISTQIDIHKKFGGVVPEIASRNHVENINSVLERALSDAKMELGEVDLIGVTNGPGLVGALVIGIGTAKALSLAKNIPLVSVNHMYGHVSANFLAYRELEPPFVCIVVSGGHTNVIYMKDYTDCEVMGATRDDAAGEAYDKVARVLGMGYPGGPAIDEISKQGKSDSVKFKRVYLEKESLDFSFSGLKTAVMNHVNHERQAGREINIADVAASFQESVVDVLIDKALQAVKIKGSDKLVLAGGVAANGRLREAAASRCRAEGVELYLPPKALCTDNAAMIASAAYYKYLKQGADDLYIDAIPNLGF